MVMKILNFDSNSLHRRYVQLEKTPRPASSAIGRMLTNKPANQPTKKETHEPTNTTDYMYVDVQFI